MKFPADRYSSAPRPWYLDGELSNLARDRYARRHESDVRWNEWVNVRDHIRLDVAAGARYPADVTGMALAADQLPLWICERRAA